MKKVGLTGNIGSGKTTIALVFEVLGIAVFYSDIEAKRLMNEDDDLKKQLISSFGKNVYLNGQLNRQYLGQLAFTDDKVLNLLNTIIHPLVQNSFNLWSDKQLGPYVIKEAAILFESNSYKTMDSIICVSCPESMRIDRLISRDNTTKEHIKNKMKKQWSDKKIRNLSDFIIANDHTSLVVPQVLAIHDTLKNFI